MTAPSRWIRDDESRPLEGPRARRERGPSVRRFAVSSGLAVSSALALASLGCGLDDETRVIGGAGRGGSGGTSSNGSAGSAGSAGTGGSPASGGSAGTGDEPAACQSPSDPFAWPPPTSVSVAADDSWKGNIELPYDPLLSLPEGDAQNQLSWVKFIVLTSDPSQIYFQSSTTYPFHYEFARDHIPAFAGMSRAELDAVTLHAEGRQAILGAVLVPSDSASHPEYGVQLVSNDDLHPALVEAVLDTVAAHVTAPTGTTPYYFPSGISAECMEGKRLDYAARGISIGSVDRWLTGDACYAPGWAVGKLVRLAAADVDAAYLDGRLTPDDILLLTDTAPAELPFVAGILTLAPSTPNAHSAILARSYGVPFAYVRDADALAATEALDGKRVVLSTTPATGRDPFDLYFDACDLRFIDVEGLAPEDMAQLRSLAAPTPIAVTPKRAAGALTLPTQGLVPADIDRVGGKAANFGVLRAAAPDNVPTPSLALTFDLWDAFMAAPAPAGQSGTLRDEIARRLAEHAWPADLRDLDATLEGVRDLIEDAPFPADLRTSVLDALAGFDPSTRIRFRSSTNVEDSESFTGAGLYDSATGCIADDLDADSAGPSACNPAELSERGVLRAIQKVYASFYFRNAYFERVRRGVDEASVGMGVLVHYSAPDSSELANGVATLTLEDGDLASGYRSAELVSQPGAISVTNPDGSALPEQVRIDQFGSDAQVATIQSASSLPLGAHALEYEGDYRALMSLFNRVADQYASVTGKAPPFGLDFEYKKLEPGILQLRQVRPLPLASSTRDVTPLFLGSPAALCLYGSERADAFAAHRLKARIATSGQSLWLTPEQLATRLYGQTHIDYVNAAATATLEGDPATLPGAAHSVEASGDEATVLDRWTAAGGTWTLRTRLVASASRGENPVRTPADFFYDLTATWSDPVPWLDYSIEEGVGFVASTRSEDAVELWGYCPEDISVNADFPHVEASFALPSGLSIASSYWYPPPPRGATAGYTAPAIKWERTTITGATTAPIVLSGYFSQTYAPNHHNFGGQYIFDPRLEPGLSASTRAELDAADIAYFVVVDQDGTEDQIWVLGLNGTLRRL